MAEDRLEQLLAAYLDGTMDSAGADELVALLAEPRAAERAHEQLVLDRLLAQRGRKPVDAAVVVAAVARGGDLADGVMRRVAADAQALRLPRRPWATRVPRAARVALACAAALVAALAGGALWFASTRPIATLVAADPSLVVLRAGRELRLDDGAALQPGDGIRCGAERATFAYADGSTVDIAPRSELEVVADARVGKRLTLTHGSLTAEVSPQLAGRPFEIVTPQAVATVVGTHFTLTVSAPGDATRLEVEHGCVRLADLARGAGVEVRAGRVGEVRAGVARLLPPPRLRATVVCAADTDGALRPGERAGAGPLLRPSTAAESRREAFLRFDVAVPGHVVGATLSLQSVEGLADGAVYVAQGAWDEDAIDPARLPRHDAQPIARIAARDGIAEVDVTAAVPARGSVTFAIAGDGVFASREAAGAEPVLTVEYEP